MLSLRSLVDEDADEMYGRLAEYLSSLRAWATALLKLDALFLPSGGIGWRTSKPSLGRRWSTCVAAQKTCVAARSALSLRPGEEAFAGALRKHAAFSDTLGADAADVAAATRRLQEKELRRLAALEDVVTHEMAGFLGYVAAETDAVLETGHVPTPEELDAAVTVDASAAEKEEGMATLAARLRRGAAAFAARPGDEALVAALLRQAANADAARATVEAFRASVLRFQAAAGSAHLAKAEAGHARM